MLKLKWEQSFDHWRCYPINGAIDLLVRLVDHGEYQSMYEIIVGVWYWSKDTGKYFHNIESAKQQAEILVAAVCKKMLKELESDATV